MMYDKICEKIGFDLVEMKKKVTNDPDMTEDSPTPFDVFDTLSNEELDYLSSASVEVLKERDSVNK